MYNSILSVKIAIIKMTNPMPNGKEAYTSNDQENTTSNNSALKPTKKKGKTSKKKMTKPLCLDSANADGSLYRFIPHFPVKRPKAISILINKS